MFRKIVAASPLRAGLVAATIAEFDGAMIELGSDDPRDRGYDLVDGVAIIGIEGALVQRLGSLRPAGGFTGADGTRAALEAAMQASAVRAVALHLDTDGGELGGYLDLADAVYAARSHKPVWAVLNENACGPGYLLASAAKRVVIPRTGRAGGVGISLVHLDYSRALRRAGIGVTVLTYGDLKADGAEVLPLSRTARDSILADLKSAGDMMIAAVARNRRLRPGSVRALEGAAVMGGAAVDCGLANAVMAPDQALAELVEAVGLGKPRAASGSRRATTPASAKPQAQTRGRAEEFAHLAGHDGATAGLIAFQRDEFARRDVQREEMRRRASERAAHGWNAAFAATRND